jgi:subtilisin family serine protease
MSSDNLRHKHKGLTESALQTDMSGHGTHVAAIAAGRQYGIAPMANIINVKVAYSNLTVTRNGLLAKGKGKHNFPG